MSIPLFCHTCGDVVGIEPKMATLARTFSHNFDSRVHVRCPGKGKHSEQIVTEKKKCFGLVKEVTNVYPETKTTSTYGVYIGPMSKFWLRFAIVFGTNTHPNGSHEGLIVNGKWTWWDRKLGLYGDGVEELVKTGKPVVAS